MEAIWPDSWWWKNNDFSIWISIRNEKILTKRAAAALRTGKSPDGCCCSQHPRWSQGWPFRVMLRKREKNGSVHTFWWHACKFVGVCRAHDMLQILNAKCIELIAQKTPQSAWGLSLWASAIVNFQVKWNALLIDDKWCWCWKGATLHLGPFKSNLQNQLKLLVADMLEQASGQLFFPWLSALVHESEVCQLRAVLNGKIDWNSLFS